MTIIKGKKPDPPPGKWKIIMYLFVCELCKKLGWGVFESVCDSKKELILSLKYEFSFSADSFSFLF